MPQTRATLPPTEPEFTHACVRCGAPIELGESLCERCNPLGLPAPASSQAHGTIFVAIVLSVVGLALLGHFAIAGVGPFRGSVASVVASGPGLHVTVSLRNDGTRAGAATCRIYDPREPGIGSDSGYLLSPQVGAGESVTFAGDVTTLGPSVRTLAADCH